MAGSPVYQCGDASYTKQFAWREADRQWFYRRREHPNGRGGRWSRWLECGELPWYAWFNPVVKARLPELRKEAAEKDN